MKEKNYNIEWIRAISCIMVIVIHVANYYSRAYGSITQGEYIFSVALNVLARVSVPCFFMISGALLLHRQDTIQQSLKRTLRVFIVLTVWSMIYYLFNTFYTHQPVSVKDILRVPAEAHLWYLYALVPIYLVLPFLQTLCRNLTPQLEKAFLIIGGVWNLFSMLLYLFDIEVFYPLPIFGEKSYLYYLFIGHMIMKYKEKIPRKPKLWLGLFFGSSILCVIATTITSTLLGYHEDCFFAYGFLFVMTSSIAFFIYMLQKENLQGKKWLTSFCSCSFGIYVMHIIFLDIFKKYVQPSDVSAYWIIPVLVIGIASATWGSIWALRKLRIGREIS